MNSGVNDAELDEVGPEGFGEGPAADDEEVRVRVDADAPCVFNSDGACDLVVLSRRVCREGGCEEDGEPRVGHQVDELPELLAHEHAGAVGELAEDTDVAHGLDLGHFGEECMGDKYSYVGAVVGATYPEQGKILRKIMPKAFILVPGYGAQGGKGKDLVHFFNEDGLGAIVNSSRGIIAAYKQEAYAKFGAENFGDASRAAVEAMIADIQGALTAAK